MAVKAQFIAGQWLPGSGATMSKLAPEDQSLLWQAASAGADDVQAACAAARAAFYPWSHRPLAERIDVVQRFAALLETHKEALATLISRETSKPLWETRTEVQAMIGKAAISIEAYHQRTGFHESTLPDGKALLQRLVEASAQIRAGKWDDQPAPFMGGVISLDAAQNMLAAQQKLEGLGGKVLLRMRQPDPRSTVLTPGIVDVTGIEVPDEEYFGPLLTIIRYDGFPEAIRLANQTRYGLAVGLISSDAAQFDQLADEARAGIVNWNKPLTGASSKAPFGGVGASGNHRAAAWYAADYCAWPMASLVSDTLTLPATVSPGLPF